MDCAESFKQSKVQLEVAHNKETDAIPDRSNSNSSCASDLSQDSAVSSIFQTDPPPLQPKPDVVESPVAARAAAEDSTLDCISRNRSSSRGSSQIQLSGTLGNHDPNRIPVSIFSGKPSNPMEWSTASNESLFSIHVGNNSFSRDHFNFLNKSGELMMSNPGLTQNPSNLPPFVEPAKVESKKEITAKPCAEPLTSTGPQIPAISIQSETDNTKEVLTPMDDLRGRHSVSNDSMNSSRSFQFPVLGGEGATPTTASSVSTDSCTTQQQPVAKQQSAKQQSMKQQSPEQQSPSAEATSASPTASSSWFSCFSWCRRR